MLNYTKALQIQVTISIFSLALLRREWENVRNGTLGGRRLMGGDGVRTQQPVSRNPPFQGIFAVPLQHFHHFSFGVYP